MSKSAYGEQETFDRTYLHGGAAMLRIRPRIAPMPAAYGAISDAPKTKKSRELNSSGLISIRKPRE